MRSAPTPRYRSRCRHRIEIGPTGRRLRTVRPRACGGVADVRILVNSDALAPIGGVEVSSLQVCRGLAERGEQIDLLYRDGGELEQHWREFAGTLRQVPNFLVTQESPARGLLSMLPAVRAAAALSPF